MIAEAKKSYTMRAGADSLISMLLQRYTTHNTNTPNQTSSFIQIKNFSYGRKEFPCIAQRKYVRFFVFTFENNITETKLKM